jgi:hypothetical protein
MYAAVSAACRGQYASQRDAWNTLWVTNQIVELDRCYTVVDSGDDLHGDGGWIDMVWVESVTQPRHSGCDLVELHAFLASI